MIRELIQLHRQFGQVALVPGAMEIAKYRKIAGVAKEDKSHKSNGLRSAARPTEAQVKSAATAAYTQLSREENPGGGMYKKKGRNGKAYRSRRAGR